jgi:pyruvate kinase
MSSRAECVMLNKGPRIVDTVEFLADILDRMEEHHDKRMNLLRRLSVSQL